MHTKLWRKKAAAFLELAQANLWTRDGSKWRNWLYDQALTGEDVKKARYGCSFKTYSRQREQWGLDPSIDNPEFTLPKGLVIPVFDDADRIVQLKIRMQRNVPQYYIVTGSKLDYDALLADVTTELDYLGCQRTDLTREQAAKARKLEEAFTRAANEHHDDEFLSLVQEWKKVCLSARQLDEPELEAPTVADTIPCQSGSLFLKMNAWEWEDQRQPEKGWPFGISADCPPGGLSALERCG